MFINDLLLYASSHSMYRKVNLVHVLCWGYAYQVDSFGLKTIYIHVYCYHNHNVKYCNCDFSVIIWMSLMTIYHYVILLFILILWNILWKTLYKTLHVRSQHSVRRAHAMNGSVVHEDSGIWLLPFDYNHNQHLVQAIPRLRDAHGIDCGLGPYCGMPFLIPVIFLFHPKYGIQSLL